MLTSALRRTWLHRIAAGALLLSTAGMLGACRWGAPENLLTEPGGITRALAAIAEKGGTDPRVLSLRIEPRELSLTVAVAGTRPIADEWRFTRQAALGMTWDEVQGPIATRTDPPGGSFDEALFRLSEIDVAAAPRFMEEALRHAKLEDPAAVTRIEIRRAFTILPRPRSGEVRWVIRVASDREAATVSFGPRGALASLDLSQTLRAKTLNLLRHTDQLPAAGTAFQQRMPGEQNLLRVVIRPRHVTFITNAPDTTTLSPIVGNMKATAIYNWNLEGLRSTFGRVDTDRIFGRVSMAPFSAPEIQWDFVDAAQKIALEKLGMPNGEVTEISLSRPTDQVGPPQLLWKVDVVDRNGQRGSIELDGSGKVEGLDVAEGRLPAVNWLDPKVLVESLTSIAARLGPDTRLGRIRAAPDGIRLGVPGGPEGGGGTELKLSQAGFRRAGNPFTLDTIPPHFTLETIQDLTAERLASMVSDAAERLRLPRERVTSISISHHNRQRSRRDAVTVEVTMQTPQGSSGWAVFELDGTLVRVMQP